jgi:hypothetical protein
MITDTAMARARLTSPLTAWILTGVTLALVLASVLLTVLTGNLAASSDGSVIALAVVFLAVGLVVAVRQPGNPVGWVLLITGLSAAFTIAAALYLQYDAGWAGGTLPFFWAVLFAENALWPVSMLVGMTALLLFPEGELSGPWRRVLWAYAAASVLVLVSQAIPAAYLVSLPHLRFGPAGQVAAQRPGGVIGFLASGLPVLAVLPFWLSWIVRLLVEFRRSAGDARQQYKWFTAGAALSCLGLVIMTVAESGGSSSALTGVVNVAATYAVIAFPLGIGLGILRYRLYDIDRIISRTVGYALVTGLLVGVYAGLVLLATQVLQFSSPVAVAASTLAAAALFAPVRRRVQRVVDRRFNRARYDADQTVAAFSARLQDAVDVDAVGADLAGVLHTSLEPAHVSVRLLGPGRHG